MNPLSGETETNGMSVVDVTDPADPRFMSTIYTTGYTDTGRRGTHKIFWDCVSGIGYLNGTPESWRINRVLQVFDLSNPDEPKFIRNFALDGSQPGAAGPTPTSLHAPFAFGDRVYLGYGAHTVKPFPISTFQTEEESGDFCNRGLRFGPHSINDAYHPGFDKALVVLSYFNAGVRVADIRDPFSPREIAYFVPKMTETTHELCDPDCNTQIQTNNVEVDDRGYIHAVDRAGTGLHILELTGEAREIAGL